MPSIPTFVLDQSCASLEEKISRFAPTFVFTRSGGFLVPPQDAAAELAAALATHGRPAPYILVGSSYAAFTQLVFASQWGESVAGMILLDPSHPKQGERALARISPDLVGTSPAVEEFRALLRGFGPGWDEGCRQVSLVTHLGDIPLVVLAAGAPEMPQELPEATRVALIRDRHGLLREYAGLSTRGALVVVGGVGHDIASLAPQIVVDAAERMLSAMP